MPSDGAYLPRDVHRSPLVSVSMGPVLPVQPSEAETLFGLFLIKFLVHDIPLAVPLDDLTRI